MSSTMYSNEKLTGDSPARNLFILDFISARAAVRTFPGLLVRPSCGGPYNAFKAVQPSPTQQSSASDLSLHGSNPAARSWSSAGNSAGRGNKPLRLKAAVRGGSARAPFKLKCPARSPHASNLPNCTKVSRLESCWMQSSREPGATLPCRAPEGSQRPLGSSPGSWSQLHQGQQGAPPQKLNSLYPTQTGSPHSCQPLKPGDPPSLVHATVRYPYRRMAARKWDFAKAQLPAPLRLSFALFLGFSPVLSLPSLCQAP